MTAAAAQRGPKRLRTTLRQPIDASLAPEMENRALFAHDAERQAAIEGQKRRVARELKRRKRR